MDLHKICAMQKEWVAAPHLGWALALPKPVANGIQRIRMQIFNNLSQVCPQRLDPSQMDQNPSEIDLDPSELGCNASRMGYNPSQMGRNPAQMS